MKQVILFFFLCLLISNAVKSQSCKNLPDQFYSYGEAIRSIQGSTFETTDELPHGKSSWIKSANYYSCNGNFGYLVYTADKGKKYVHEKVPIKVWSEFKNAKSSGSYYVNNIKGRYRLVPE